MTRASQVPTVALPAEVTMPMVGFGTWQLPGRRAYDAVRYALEVGYRHIDTATMYGNEAEVGRALRDSGLPREAVFITTKLPPGNAGRARQTIAASLRALGTDHVDLWLVHWPPGGPGVELWRRFVAARDDGRARDVGVSNYSLDQVDVLTDRVGVTPAVDQVRWAPSLFDPAVEDGLRERGVVLEGYSPFKSSDLADPVLREVAERHGVRPSQVVLRWHLEHGVVVIPKSADPGRIAANLDVTGFTLADDEVTRIDRLAAR
jgi:2,5-diketo-D-gluconate reductase A